MTDTTVASTRHTPSASMETTKGGSPECGQAGRDRRGQAQQGVCASYFAWHICAEQGDIKDQGEQEEHERDSQAAAHRGCGRAAGRGRRQPPYLDRRGRSPPRVTRPRRLPCRRIAVRSGRRAGAARAWQALRRVYRPPAAARFPSHPDSGSQRPDRTNRFPARKHTACVSCGRPRPRRAAQGTTGMPSSRCRASVLIRIRFLRASSIRLRQSTAFGMTSSTCRTKIRLRSRQVASATRMAASASPEARKSRATRSSRSGRAGNKYRAGRPASGLYRRSASRRMRLQRFCRSSSQCAGGCR